MKSRLRIAFLGGQPPVMGGGGLDVQMMDTQHALEEQGHTVLRAERADATAEFDLLHVFGAGPVSWSHLKGWHKNRKPLVVSPVLLGSSGLRQLSLLSARFKIGYTTTLRMRYEVVRAADKVIALTDDEKSTCVRHFGASTNKVVVIENGCDAATEPQAETLPDGVSRPYLVMVGSVPTRKRQADTLKALGNSVPVVIAGAFLGKSEDRTRWEQSVQASRAIWLGKITDRSELLRLQADAAALVLMSKAEGQSMAVLDSLALGVPVIVSDIPSHRESKIRYPDLVHIASSDGELKRLCSILLEQQGPLRPALVPGWKEIAAQLEAVYLDVLERPRPVES